MNGLPRFSTVDGSRSVAGCDSSLCSFLSKCLRGFLLFLMGIYRTIGTTHLGGQCRFDPSCSEYAVEALRAHPPFLALRFISVRLCKCRPGGPFGYDPVPAADSDKRSPSSMNSVEGIS